MSARVAVLGGGPDAERPVSIESSTAVTKALQDAGVDAELHLIDAPNPFGSGNAARLIAARLTHTGSVDHDASLAA